MKQGIGVSHAKLILIGEHSVVYHMPAIALPFNALTCQVIVQACERMTLDCEIYTGDLSKTPLMLHPIQCLIETLNEHLKLGTFLISITSNIPTGAGLGSSAAIASAVTQAMFDYADISLSDDERLHWIHYSETLAHGNPSGVDALTTSFDSAWWFVKEKPPMPLMLSLPAYLIIAQTHQLGSTKLAVQKVKEYVNQYGLEHINALGQLTHLCLQSIQIKDIEAIGRCMVQAHLHLQACGVSTPTLDNLVTLALDNGALGAKLTGGGLGGCMIALAKNLSDCENISLHLKKHTPHVWSHHLL